MVIRSVKRKPVKAISASFTGKGMFNSKKGFGWAWFFGSTASALISAPWVLLGIAIFVLIGILLFYLALGKILGAVIIAAGVASVFKIRWWVGLIIILLGAMIFYNPFHIAALGIMW